jgi:hypothetical protein
MAPPFRKVDRNLPSEQTLEGKQIFFALYSDRVMSEAKLFIGQDLATLIDCGAPLDHLLTTFRQAIIDSARVHGNPTAPQS